MRKFLSRISGYSILFLAIAGLLLFFAIIPERGGLFGIKTILAKGGDIDSVFAQERESRSESPPAEGGAPRKPLWETDWSHALNIIATLLLASVLSGLISYRRRGGSAQIEFTEAHIILSVAAALMMMIIGSQIARAFGLMGAASIVRYRYSLKSPKEASSLVIALGIGMACGVGLFPLAIIASLYIVLMNLLFAHIPQKLKKALFPASWTWNLRVRTTDPEKTLAMIKELLSKNNVNYKVKELQGDKGAENNQTDIEVEIYGNIDRNAFAENISQCGVVRVRWRQEKTENYIDMDMDG